MRVLKKKENHVRFIGITKGVGSKENLTTGHKQGGDSLASRVVKKKENIVFIESDQKNRFWGESDLWPETRRRLLPSIMSNYHRQLGTFFADNCRVCERKTIENHSSMSHIYHPQPLMVLTL